MNYNWQNYKKKGRTDGARILNINQTDKLLSHYYDDAKTLYELFLKAAKMSSKISNFKPTLVNN